MNNLIFLSIIFSFSLSQAAFYSPENLPQKPQNLDRFYNASTYIGYNNTDHSTGVAISNDGYILLNLHSMRDCLSSVTNSYFEDFIDRAESPDGVYDLWVSKKQNFKNLTCKNYTSWYEELYQGDPTVIWIGRGKGSFEESEILNIPPDIIKSIATNADDFAILKYNLHGKTAPCVPLAKKEMIAGDSVWSSGYPAQTFRQEGFNSDGVHKFLATGKLRASIHEDPYLKQNFTSEQQWKLESEIYDQSRFLLTDLDTFNGSSGSPIVNKDGELMGIVFANIMPSKDVNNNATTIGLKSQHIFQEVSAGLGLAQAKKIFNCPTTAAAPPSRKARRIKK